MWKQLYLLLHNNYFHSSIKVVNIVQLPHIWCLSSLLHCIAAIVLIIEDTFQNCCRIRKVWLLWLLQRESSSSLILFSCQRSRKNNAFLWPLLYFLSWILCLVCIITTGIRIKKKLDSMNIPHVQKISSRPFQQFSKRCEVRLGQIASGIPRSTEEQGWKEGEECCLIKNPT